MTRTEGTNSKLQIRDAQREDIPIMAKLLQEAFAKQLEPILDPTPTPEYLKFREQQVERFMIQREHGMPAKLDLAIDRESQNIVGFCLYYTESSPQERTKQEEKFKDKLITPQFPSNGQGNKYAYFQKCLKATAEKYEVHPTNHIGLLVVDSSYRNGGVGGVLLERACTSNSSPSYLEAVLRAVPFYKRHQFDTCGTMVKAEGNDEDFFLPTLEIMLRPGSNN